MQGLSIAHAWWSWLCTIFSTPRTAGTHCWVCPSSDLSFCRTAMTLWRSKPGIRALSLSSLISSSIRDFSGFVQNIHEDNAFVQCDSLWCCDWPCGINKLRERVCSGSRFGWLAPLFWIWDKTGYHSGVMCGRSYLLLGGQEKETWEEMRLSRRGSYFWGLGLVVTDDYRAQKITPSLLHCFIKWEYREFFSL